MPTCCCPGANHAPEGFKGPLKSEVLSNDYCSYSHHHYQFLALPRLTLVPRKDLESDGLTEVGIAEALHSDIEGIP